MPYFTVSSFFFILCHVNFHLFFVFLSLFFKRGISLRTLIIATRTGWKEEKKIENFIAYVMQNVALKECILLRLWG